MSEPSFAIRGESFSSYHHLEEQKSTNIMKKEQSFLKSMLHKEHFFPPETVNHVSEEKLQQLFSVKKKCNAIAKFCGVKERASKRNHSNSDLIKRQHKLTQTGCITEEKAKYSACVWRYSVKHHFPWGAPKMCFK